MATDPTLQHGGVGSAVLGALCADLAARGVTTGEVAWVSNLRFYGKCGARVSRVFLGGRKTLEQAPELASENSLSGGFRAQVPGERSAGE